MKFLLAIRYVMVLPLLILTLITTPAASSTDTAELIGTDTFVADQAFIMGQGITTDGEYYYTSGALAGINAGGVYDEYGGGNGWPPSGITYSRGITFETLQYGPIAGLD